MTSSRKHSIFQKVSLTTLVAVYFLILVGGIVRSTGAGMGCPDWPKCFGSWVPPTDASQLPADYKEYYSDYRHQKNVRFAKYLDVLGFDKEAEILRNDTSIRVESDFNVYKTWTEYANRLTGTIIGFLIIITMVSAWVFVREDKKLLMTTVITLIAVIFQGWIGSVVVSTNLMPWMITIHMLLALGIILLLIYVNFRSRRTDYRLPIMRKASLISILVIVSLVMMGVQIILGTQVREAIDVVASNLAFALRETWVSRIGAEFFIHRSFSLLILLIHGLLLFLLLKNAEKTHTVRKAVLYIIILVGVEIISGMVMAYMGIPAFVQPVHLLLSTILFGLLYYVFLLIHYTNKKTAIS